MENYLRGLAPSGVLYQQPGALANPPPKGILESVLRNQLPMEGRLTFLPAMVNNGQREWALPGILASAWNAFTAPARAYGGNMADPMGEAMNFAGMMNLGAMPSPAAGGPGTLGMNVYHGSPHKFDKFDANLAGKRGGTSFGLGHNLSEDVSHAAVYKGKSGYLYKVDIPDESINNFIKWESAVPESIAKQIPKIDKGRPLAFGGGATVEQTADGWVLKSGNTSFRLSEKEVERMFGDSNTGEQVYRKLTAALGSEDAASEWLKSRGYAGISNSTERGANNYSVFPGNEHLLKIIGRE